MDSKNRIEVPEQLKDAVGRRVVIDGVAKRSKAGSFLWFRDLQIWCSKEFATAFLGRNVRMVGVLTQGSSPLRTFPTATCDENGAWSQGVLTPDSLGIGMDPLRSGMTKKKERKGPQRDKGKDGLLKVQDLSMLD